MGNNLTLQEWQLAYNQNPQHVRRQIQTLLTLYRKSGEMDKLEAVKQIWLSLTSKELKDDT